MPAQQCNVIAFVWLYVCCKYNNNHLYWVNKEDIKWLSYLSVEYSSSCESNFLEKNIELIE